MSKVLVGYFIRRTWKQPPHPGKTLFAESHRLYDTHKKASRALEQSLSNGHLDDRYDYSVAEAWMHTEETP